MALVLVVLFNTKVKHWPGILFEINQFTCLIYIFFCFKIKRAHRYWESRPRLLGPNAADWLAAETLILRAIADTKGSPVKLAKISPTLAGLVSLINNNGFSLYIGERSKFLLN